MSKPSPASSSSSSSPSSAPCHAFIESPFNLSYFIACLTSNLSLPFSNSVETSTTATEHETTNLSSSSSSSSPVLKVSNSSLIGSNQSIPCYSQLQAYELCVETHNGVAPRPYESEWCEEEKQAYLHCRNTNKQQPHTTTKLK